MTYSSRSDILAIRNDFYLHSALRASDHPSPIILLIEQTAFETLRNIGRFAEFGLL